MLEVHALLLCFLAGVVMGLVPHARRLDCVVLARSSLRRPVLEHRLHVKLGGLLEQPWLRVRAGDRVCHHGARVLHDSRCRVLLSSGRDRVRVLGRNSRLRRVLRGTRVEVARGRTVGDGVQRLMLLARNLGGVSSAAPLELEVFANGLVKQSHGGANHTAARALGVTD